MTSISASIPSAKESMPVSVLQELKRWRYRDPARDATGKSCFDQNYPDTIRAVPVEAQDQVFSQTRSAMR